MGKLQIIGRLARVATAALTPVALDEATKIINRHLDKRKDYVKIPDVKSLSLNEAAKVLEQYEFNYALVKVKADVKYAYNDSDTVLRILPKGGANVDPTTFVKLYYADEETIKQSNDLFKDMMDQKVDKQEKRQQTVRDLTDKTKQVATDVSSKLGLTKKDKSDI
ncbi:PASTA domain-containing protein [Weissella paramesenteroides]|uniref:PASTA domain-containing protein n=1 Tax=Weissella paramesenteroides TaxID=1249 RepID=UPI00103E219C|nr:PASTA domain-containing protein [Weissella paramesenteroides]RZQ57660.1 PASTA domain-containing protein [Weissella paramesenteroides]